MISDTPRPSAVPVDATLREVVEQLAPLSRRAGSPGEQEAAYWLASRLERAGCRAVVEEEEFLDGYARVIGGIAAASAIAGVGAFGRRTRKPSAVAAALLAAAVADDVSNGPRLVRRAVSKPKTTWNVVAECGPANAERTLVVLAHHDAATAGSIFDDRAQAWVADRIPGIIERIDTGLPVWWAVMAAPSAVALGAARSRRGLVGLGLGGSILASAVFADVERRPVCPGANDNLAAVGVLVALAEHLRERPIDGLRVLLASCGAEEVLQGGIHGFARRHFPSLDRERTWFLNLETVGSPTLILLEGEGPVVMEDYFDRSFRDLVARTAEGAGAPLRRGMRSRTSTDAVIPSRAGYPVATLGSMDRFKALSNYHKMTDTADRVDYTTAAQALMVTEAVARELAVNPWLGRPTRR